ETRNGRVEAARVNAATDSASGSALRTAARVRRDATDATVTSAMATAAVLSWPGARMSAPAIATSAAKPTPGAHQAQSRRPASAQIPCPASAEQARMTVAASTIVATLA